MNGEETDLWQELSAAESFVWVLMNLIQDLHSQEAIFLEESLDKVTFATWKRQPASNWVDTSWYKLTLCWHWTALLRHPVGGGAGIGTETLCILL